VTDHPPATAPPADDGMMPSSRLAALAVDRDERLLRIRDRVLRDAAACGGCRDSAFRHSLSCDVLHIAQPDPRRRSS
jgi:hypothetical protein